MLAKTIFKKVFP